MCCRIATVVQNHACVSISFQARKHIYENGTVSGFNVCMVGD